MFAQSLGMSATFAGGVVDDIPAQPARKAENAPTTITFFIKNPALLTLIYSKITEAGYNFKR